MTYEWIFHTLIIFYSILKYSDGVEENVEDKVRLIANYKFSKLYISEFTRNLLNNTNLTKSEMLEEFSNSLGDDYHEDDKEEIVKMFNRSLYDREMVGKILSDQETRKAVLLTMINNSTRSVIRNIDWTKKQKLNFIEDFLSGFDKVKRANIISFYEELFSWDDTYHPHLMNPVERAFRSYYFSREISLIIQNYTMVKSEQIQMLNSTEFVQGLHDTEKETAMYWYSESIDETVRLKIIADAITYWKSTIHEKSNGTTSETLNYQALK